MLNLSCWRIFAFALSLIFVSTAAAQPKDEDVKELLKKIDSLWYGTKSNAQVQMTVKTARYSRTMELEYWIKGERFTLIKILAPAKEKGTATLKVDRDIFNYLPKISRTVKISQALLAGSWMGSHFTNDDLTKSTRFAADFTRKILSEEQAGKDLIWRIELKPKDAVVLPYDHIELTVNKTSVQPVSQKFFDGKNKLVRTVSYLEPKTLGGHVVPSVVLVQPAGEAGESTELVYLKIDRAVEISDDFFSLTRFKNQ